MKNWNYKNYSVRQFEKLDSTNSEALKMADDKVVVLADAQEAGRGRLTRAWQSPAGNLYFSLGLRSNLDISRLYELSFVAICAMSLAVEKILPQGARVNLKWPNDLLVDGKKLSGVLIESKIAKNKCEFVVIGIGVNIASKPENVMFEACCLKDFGVEILPQDLLVKFLDEFDDLYQNWIDYGFKKARNIWLGKAFKLGEKITVKNGDEEIQGIFEGLDEDGSLILKGERGVKKISVADVS